MIDLDERRERIAAQVLAAIVGGQIPAGYAYWLPKGINENAEYAVKHADALLAALAKPAEDDAKGDAGKPPSDGEWFQFAGGWLREYAGDAFAASVKPSGAWTVRNAAGDFEASGSATHTDYAKYAAHTWITLARQREADCACGKGRAPLTEHEPDCPVSIPF